jgi:hypothetical protein
MWGHEVTKTNHAVKSQHGYQFIELLHPLDKFFFQLFDKPDDTDLYNEVYIHCLYLDNQVILLQSSKWKSACEEK